jgi:hypothetical protein
LINWFRHFGQSGKKAINRTFNNSNPGKSIFHFLFSKKLNNKEADISLIFLEYSKMVILTRYFDNNVTEETKLCKVQQIIKSMNNQVFSERDLMTAFDIVREELKNGYDANNRHQYNLVTFFFETILWEDYYEDLFIAVIRAILDELPMSTWQQLVKYEYRPAYSPYKNPCIAAEIGYSGPDVNKMDDFIYCKLLDYHSFDISQIALSKKYRDMVTAYNTGKLTKAAVKNEN